MRKDLNTRKIEVETVKEKMAQTPKSYVKRISIYYVFAEGIVISADIQSRTRNGLLHYTRIVLNPLTLETVKASCDCEGYTFRHHCWHIETLKQLAETELKEQIEKTREEMLSIEEDIASWG